MTRTILLVDDHAVIRNLLRSTFERHAEWVICGEAENGQIAVDKVAELHPDIVILDLQMPVMNGLEAARQISQLAPKTTMLLLTMHSSPQLSREAKAVGINHVLSKIDVRPEHLLTALGRASG